MDFKTIKVDEKDNKIIVTILEKRIYLGITDIFRDEILELLKNVRNDLVVDLNRVAVMNSAGLGVLIMARDIINKNNGEIKLCGLQPLMQDIFSRMRLDTLFKILPSTADAISE